MPLDEKKPLLNNRPSFRGEGGVTSGYYRTDRSDPPRQLSCAAEATVSGDNGTMDREEMGGGRDVNSNSPARQFGTESRLAKVVLIAVTISYFLGYIPSMVIMNPFIYDRVSNYRLVSCCKNELHRTISLVSYITKILLRIIMMRVRKKIKPEIAEEQCGFVEEKSTINTIYTVLIITERALEIQKEAYLCFADYTLGHLIENDIMG